eukprot:1081603_1
MTTGLSRLEEYDRRAGHIEHRLIVEEVRIRRSRMDPHEPHDRTETESNCEAKHHHVAVLHFGGQFPFNEEPTDPVAEVRDARIRLEDRRKRLEEIHQKHRLLPESHCERQNVSENVILKDE